MARPQGSAAIAVLAVLAVLVAGGPISLHGGVYDVAAREGHTGLGRWALDIGGRDQESETHTYILQPAESRVWFEAEANVGSFDGETKHVQGWVRMEDTVSLSGARGEVQVQVRTFRTGIGLRDRHLRAEMEADRYPLITFALQHIETAAPHGDRDTGVEREVLLHGALTIKAATREVEIPALITPAGNRLRVRGRIPIRLTDYGIEPPTRLLGMARMKNALELAFDAVFAPENPAAARVQRSRVLSSR